MTPSTFIDSEIVYPGPLKRGSTGSAVRFLQELLCLAKYPTSIDGTLGAASEGALFYFEQDGLNNKHAAQGVIPNGFELSPNLHSHLVQGFEAIIKSVPPATDYKYFDWVLTLAEIARKKGAREVGGANKGPWVRLFCGQEGPSYAWCAGFVCWCLSHAAYHYGVNTQGETPLGPYTLSCDVLAAQAKSRGWLTGDVTKIKAAGQGIFLLRKSSLDWVHTGFIIATYPEYFVTIEGNTNDGGSREGTDVLIRFRSYNPSTDYIVFPDGVSKLLPLT